MSEQNNNTTSTTAGNQNSYKEVRENIDKLGENFKSIIMSDPQVPNGAQYILMETSADALLDALNKSRLEGHEQVGNIIRKSFSKNLTIYAALVEKRNKHKAYEATLIELNKNLMSLVVDSADELSDMLYNICHPMLEKAGESAERKEFFNNYIHSFVKGALLTLITDTEMHPEKYKALIDRIAKEPITQYRLTSLINKLIALKCGLSDDPKYHHYNPYFNPYDGSYFNHCKGAPGQECGYGVDPEKMQDMKNRFKKATEEVTETSKKDSSIDLGKEIEKLKEKFAKSGLDIDKAWQSISQGSSGLAKDVFKELNDLFSSLSKKVSEETPKPAEAKKPEQNKSDKDNA